MQLSASHSTCYTKQTWYRTSHTCTSLRRSPHWKRKHFRDHLKTVEFNMKWYLKTWKLTSCYILVHVLTIIWSIRSPSRWRFVLKKKVKSHHNSSHSCSSFTESFKACESLCWTESHESWQSWTRSVSQTCCSRRAATRKTEMSPLCYYDSHLLRCFFHLVFFTAASETFMTGLLLHHHKALICSIHVVRH